MAKQLFVKLQSPTVDVTVNSEPDASGQSASIVVGFKRYTLDKIESILEQFKESASSEADAIEFIKSQIVYIKNVSLDIYDDEQFVETLVIEDTRTTQPFAPFWETSKEALAVLSSHYLNSTPWKGQLTNGFMTALVNKDYKEAEVKN